MAIRTFDYRMVIDKQRVCMSKFCEGCPDRGSCVGDIVAMEVLSTSTRGAIAEDGSASLSVEYGDPIGPTDAIVRYKDAEAGTSETVAVHGDSGTDAQNKGFEYVDRVGRCTGPSVKKFLGIVVKRECSAPRA